MYLYILPILSFYLSLSRIVSPKLISSYSSLECIEPNVYVNQFNCNLTSSMTTTTGVTQCYRLCRDINLSGRSKTCDAFAFNATEGSGQCFLCNQQSTGEYLLSEIQSAQKFVKEEEWPFLYWPLLYWSFDGNNDDLSYSLYNGAILTTGWVCTNYCHLSLALHLLSR